MASLLKRSKRAVSPIVGHILIFGIMITSLSILYANLNPALSRFETENQMTSIELSFRTINKLATQMLHSAVGASSQLEFNAGTGMFNVSRGLYVSWDITSANDSLSDYARTGELTYLILGQYEESALIYHIGNYLHPTSIQAPTSNQQILVFDNFTAGRYSTVIPTLYEKEFDNRKYLGFYYRLLLTLVVIYKGASTPGEVFLDITVYELNTTRLVTGRSRYFPISGNDLTLVVKRQSTTISEQTKAMQGTLTISPKVSSVSVSSLSFDSSYNAVFGLTQGYTLHYRLIKVPVYVDLQTS